MDLSFDNKKVRTLCENEQAARCELGEAVAEMLKHRIADLWAASSIDDLLVSPPQELEGSNGTVMTISLCNNYRLLFTPNHVKKRELPSGQPDWSKVVRVKILAIEQVHA